jgi:hypothetical protein
MYMPASGIECDQGSDWSCIKRASGITRAVIGHVYAF